MSDDELDRVALERMWPDDRGRWSWLGRVGHTRQQREGLRPHRPETGPRGRVERPDQRTYGGRCVVTRSTVSGEIG